jgi:hypothetical protein
MDADADQKVKSASVEAIIHKADGRVINLGTLDATYSNPVRQWWHDHIVRPRTIKRIEAYNEQTRREIASGA